MTRLQAYFTPEVKKDMFVTSNMEVDPLIEMHLDIVFPNCPCGILDFKFQTGYTTWQRTDMPQFKFFNIDRLTNEVIDEAPLTMDLASTDKYKKIKEQLDKGMGCLVQGSHDMYQVPSKLFFATDRDTWLITKLQKDAPDTYNKFSLDHYFQQFAFGDLTQAEGIQEHFAEYPEHTRLDMVKDQVEANRAAIMNQEGDFVHYNFYKFISVVPHMFLDTSTEEEVDFRSYSYALTLNKKKPDKEQGVNMVMMIFEFSPVSMSITKSNQPLSRFIISICAIVGGVFVVFGLINSSLLEC